MNIRLGIVYEREMSSHFAFRQLLPLMVATSRDEVVIFVLFIYAIKERKCSEMLVVTIRFALYA